jgi:hypothetical protein
MATSEEKQITTSWLVCLDKERIDFLWHFHESPSLWISSLSHLSSSYFISTEVSFGRACYKLEVDMNILANMQKIGCGNA